jgi:hypothetical protein
MYILYLFKQIMFKQCYFITVIIQRMIRFFRRRVIGFKKQRIAFFWRIYLEVRQLL